MKLFPNVKGLLHGGDYNPEQWLDRPDILEEDIRLMKEAGMNTATLGVFSWAMYEPKEGEFHFEWLEAIINNLYENGIYTVLATPTGARPAWMDAAYQEVMRVAGNGVRNHHGVRHNHCMSSPIYREKTAVMDTKLAERFGNHPGVILWHISNEFGGECYCDLCQNKFRIWLKDRYHNDISELNKAWWTTFWSHNYTSFDQIEAPMPNGEMSVAGLRLDWRRFTTYNMTDFMKFEISVLRKNGNTIPVTTNFMRMYRGLDYEVMAKELDVIAWDSYPAWGNDEETLYRSSLDVAFDHSMMRSFLPGKPFMLMESTPSLVNWHPFNKLKRPGIHKLSSLQALANGSDTVQYFQWRKGRGSFEQYHGAVMDHLGRSDTRTYLEVKELGEILNKLEPLTGSVIKAETALLFDWNTRWAVEDLPGLSSLKKYDETCKEQYRILQKLGVETDVITPSVDFSGYKVLVAPMLYLLRQGLADRLKLFVDNGGILLCTYLTGYVDNSTLCYLGGFPGDGLMELFGLYAEEIDTLYPKDINGVSFEDTFLEEVAAAQVQYGSSYGRAIEKTAKITDFCEVLKVQDAEIIGNYTNDFYKGTPVVTRNHYGAGDAYYIGARLCESGMEAIYQAALATAGVTRVQMQEGVEFHRRTKDNKQFDFYMNETENEVTVVPAAGGRNLLNGEEAKDRLILQPFETAVLEHI